MGGSSCGVKALRDMLFDEKNNQRELFILDNTSSHSFSRTLEKIKLEESLFLIISKTGSTIEVVSLFKLLIEHFKLDMQELKKYFIFITDKDSKLHKEGENLGIKCFFIPANVGGRFSILSAVGIVPLCFCGYNTKALLEGAKACFEDFFIHKKDEILQKAYHYCTHKSANINVLFSYSDAFKGFNEWYIQLIAESLGKKQGYKRIGLTPIALIGARDQHSFLQLIMDGPKNKTITFLKIKDSQKAPVIPDIHFKFLDDLSNKVNLHDLLNTQCDATMHALIAENLSVDIIELEKLDAWHAGYLMYYYELFTSACGVMLGINTYDQPGVEVGKLILKNILKS
ncbi:glucose-6-phosphate isomerase, partial [Campylobacter coli]|nr:glucose-6-phosphate isomerase [Campylobacter coli]